MPCVVVVGIEVGDNTIRKFNQSEAQEGALRVSRPVHIGCAGLLTAGAAWVIGPNASSRITRTDLEGDTFDRLWAEHCQRYAGVGTVGPVNGEGQLVAEATQAVIHRIIVRPGVVFLIGCPVQAVAVQLGGVALGTADTHGLTSLTDHQSLTAGHRRLLKQS